MTGVFNTIFGKSILLIEKVKRLKFFFQDQTTLKKRDRGCSQAIFFVFTTLNQEILAAYNDLRLKMEFLDLVVESYFSTVELS